MKKNFLTTTTYFNGLYNSFLERLTGKSNKHRTLVVSELKLVRWIKKQNGYHLSSVGVFDSVKKGKVIVKLVFYSYPNLIYKQLLNEVSVLEVLRENLSKVSTRVLVPKIYQTIQKPGVIGFSEEFISGKKLQQFSVEFKKQALKDCLETFIQIKPQALAGFMQKTPLVTLLSFPIYWFNLLLRDPLSIVNYLRWMWLFITNYLSVFKLNPDYFLAHRDLHTENIIVNGKKLFLIDPEIACLAEGETDLAILVRQFSREIGVKQIVTFIESLSLTKTRRKRFIALSIYYAIQMMAIRSNEDPDFKEAHDYLLKALPAIISAKPSYHQAPAEVVQKIGLITIYYINKILNSFLTNSPLILCYHSVGRENWRFSVNISEFEKQMNYLKKNYRVVSLEKILSGRADKNEVALTFDDGYLDTMTQAAPVLKKLKLPATLFVLGTPERANRSELDNQLSLLTVNQIKQLKKMGWEIGFHTNTHSDLRSLNEKELFQEIVMGKKQIEKKLGFKLRYFAYPRGLYNTAIMNAVKEARFSEAFTVDGGYFSSTDPLFLKKRISMEKGISMKEFQSLLSPLGVYFMGAFMTLLKTKEALQHNLRVFINSLSVPSVMKGENINA